jgi:prepilin-type N-terminal cleavage/methylation domain-containing protein
MPAFPSPKRAFTLIELLVVISIISLLISILLPSLQGARTAAHRTASMSNMRQIAIAMTGYSADHKDRLPFGVGSYWQGSYYDINRDTYWTRRLVDMKYVSSPSVYWSPARPRPFTGSVPPNNNNGYDATHYMGNVGALQYESYYRNWLGGLPNGYAWSQPLNLSESGTPPHATFLLLRTAWVTAEQTGGTVFGTALGGGGRYNSGASANRIYSYNGDMPRAYVDGHAQSLGRNTSQYIYYVPSGTSYKKASPDDLGWDTNYAHANNGMVTGGSYGGWWRFWNDVDLERSSPYYARWRGTTWGVYGP